MIREYSSENIFKLLSTESRRADLSPGKLAKVHSKLGELLGHRFLDEFELEDIDIQHVQGIKRGKCLPKDKKFLIIVLMRGGLYVAEGFKEVIDNHYVIEFVDKHNVDEILAKYDLTYYHSIIVDSVINTGKSVIEILNKINLKESKKVYVISLVMQKKVVNIFENMDNVNCYVARISSNFYIGKGNTDTGNRLFGTMERK